MDGTYMWDYVHGNPKTLPFIDSIIKQVKFELFSNKQKRLPRKFKKSLTKMFFSKQQMKRITSKVGGLYGK